MKIAILGYDIEGRSSYEYLTAHGHQLEIRDQNPEVETPAGVEALLGERYLDDLDQFDLLVRTPSLHPRKILEKNPGIEAKMTSQINLFMQASPSKHIIGVTGTKGKGTTSTLIAELLKATGKTVYLGGNIGVPPLSFIDKLDADSRVVLELSSFQLIDLQTSPHYALCLLVVPEHQDWHADEAEYYTAKAQLFVHQTRHDKAFYYADNEISQQIAAVSKGEKIPYFAPPGAVVQDGTIQIDGQTICKTDELKLLGKHNWQNVCAAVTVVWQLSQDIEVMRGILTSFVGLPFRIEFRAEKNGIRYYNDSFAASPPAPVAAIEAIDGHKVVILGGFDRQLDLDELCKGIVKNASGIRNLLLIGASRERLASTLKDQGFNGFMISDAQTMPEVVAAATALAQSGDAVILSPGFPSFDMFKNFEDRGNQFNAAVEAL